MRELRRPLAVLVVLTLLVVAYRSTTDGATGPEAETETETDPTSTTGGGDADPSDPAPDGPAVLADDQEAEPGEEPADEPGAACLAFRELVVAEIPCDRLVTPTDEATCRRPSGEVIDCSAVPAPARIGQVAGAVLAGQPARPEIDAVQFGSGPGPTSTALVMFTGAPLPQPTTDRLEIAVVYESDDGGPSCRAPGEAWDGASFASVLALGPDEVAVTDLGCRPDGFADIGQRSSWLVAGDRVVVYLPIDLPGAPAKVVGAFRPAPAFAAVDAGLAVRVVAPDSWDFDEPVRP